MFNSRLALLHWRLAPLAIVVLIITGCATSPLETRGTEVSGTGPAHVLSDRSRIGDRVVWGGRILQVHNLADRTEIVVASHPLNRSDRPDASAEPGVRFVLNQPGFLEPQLYAPGRFVSVLGRVTGVEDRPVGEYAYQHPVLDAEDIYLWPADRREWDRRPNFGIGIGIRL